MLEFLFPRNSATSLVNSDNMRLKARKFASYVTLLLCYIFVSYLFLISDYHVRNQITEEVWSSRRAAVKEVCQSNAVLLPKPKQLTAEASEQIKIHFTNIYNKQILFNLVSIRELHLNWCLVPKVASTSISRVLLPYLPRKKDTTGWPHIQKEVWQKAGHIQLGEYLANNSTPAFLVTRHPFARVASAFRNKLEDRTKSHDGEYFYKTYSKQIIKYSRGGWSLNEPEPTFAEFIHFLINTDINQYDEHWQPIALRCRMCQLDYSHILHYENLAYEWSQFLNSIGLTQILELPWENKAALNDLQRYYDIISGDEKQQLFLKFESDFKMFGYSMEDDF
eukprot:TRINITY_DN18994_c0_g1_i1.p1 TRINITY_DN18994_c0_g1~~TRINITY_DN18994_c0_g1_i1.p1  ORF type:complete len:336 (+),score=47.19 TRINITY_DN18994_c0_g1_i1:103-1110(+)